MNSNNQISGYSPQRRRIEDLLDVPPERVTELLQEYRDLGADVQATAQPNGLFHVQAAFLETLDLPVSSSEGRPVYKRSVKK